VQLFGPHLLLDGSRCNTQKLGDRLLIERLLSDYPAAIGMTKIGGPYMFAYQAPDPAYSGVSGIVVIAESHIAIHTFPALDYFTMDIFSCKTFDHEAAIRYIQDALEVGQMDRMLVQRGLGFRGPHHGAAGATDELIAAAEARLAAGIVSVEMATPEVREATDARASATTRTTGEEVLAPREPIQLNPTASISGLLDKLRETGLGGRAVGRALDEWERLARDPDCQVVLALSMPLVVAGLRDLLAAAIERRYVDVVIMTGEDVFADVHAALSGRHIRDDGEPAANLGHDQTLTFLADSAATLAKTDQDLAGWEFLRALGGELAARAPRMGVLQAAYAAGVPLFAPDLVASPCGTALIWARRRPAAPRLDLLADLAALADRLSESPRHGVIAAGRGVATSALAQACAVAGPAASHSAGGICLDSARDAVALGADIVVVESPPGLVLPLLLTGLAQRLPGKTRVPGLVATPGAGFAR
jgi:S-adenosylmethionine decarboxylase